MHANAILRPLPLAAQSSVELMLANRGFTDARAQSNSVLGVEAASSPADQAVGGSR